MGFGIGLGLGLFLSLVSEVKHSLRRNILQVFSSDKASAEREWKIEFDRYFHVT
jgi:hypothetical protein